jgi:hypothetical protein
VCLLAIAVLGRYLDAAQDPNNPFRTYGSYENMKQQVLAKSDETDLKAPIALCEMYGQQTEALLNAIHATQVCAGQFCWGQRHAAGVHMHAMSVVRRHLLRLELYYCCFVIGHVEGAT